VRGATGHTGWIFPMYLYFAGLVCWYGERGDVDGGASHGVAIEGCPGPGTWSMSGVLWAQASYVCTCPV
jgi:hypothetical protein